MQNLKKVAKKIDIDNQSLEKLAKGTQDLLDNVLLIRKTPKYERLRGSEKIENSYIQDNLLNGW